MRLRKKPKRRYKNLRTMTRKDWIEWSKYFAYAFISMTLLSFLVGSFSLRYSIASSLVWATCIIFKIPARWMDDR